MPSMKPPGRVGIGSKDVSISTITIDDPIAPPAKITDSHLDRVLADTDFDSRPAFHKAFRHRAARRGLDAIDEILDVTVEAMKRSRTREGLPDHKVRLAASEFMLRCFGVSGPGSMEEQPVQNTINQVAILASGGSGADAVESFFKLVRSRQTGVPVERISNVVIPDVDHVEVEDMPELVVQESR